METQLVNDGIALDPNKEHEIFNHENGLKVTVSFGPKFSSKTAVFRNITEVHWMYPSIHEKRVAFESDIHCTGYTYAISDILSVSTEKETEIAEEI